MNKNGLKAVAGVWIAIATISFVIKMIVEHPDTIGMVLTVVAGVVAFVMITIGSGD